METVCQTGFAGSSGLQIYWIRPATNKVQFKNQTKDVVVSTRLDSRTDVATLPLSDDRKSTIANPLDFSQIFTLFPLASGGHSRAGTGLSGYLNL